MKVAIIVSSCDFFKECWGPFIYSVKKYWGDCRYPMYILSNNNSIETPEGISFVKVGEDKKFSSNLKVALKQVDADYVIYLQEDYWLNKLVDSKAIDEHLQYCVENDVDYLRLGVPFMYDHQINDRYNEHSLKSLYALCLQAAIWKKDTLLQLLLDGNSGWDFEYHIQQYAIANGIKVRAIGMDRNHESEGIRYVLGTSVRKGRWTREGYKFLKENGFESLMPKRDVEGWVFGTFQEVHGPLRPLCLAVVKVMKIMNWNF